MRCSQRRALALLLVVLPLAWAQETNEFSGISDEPPLGSKADIEQRLLKEEADYNRQQAAKRTHAPGRPGRRRKRKSWLNMLGVGGTDADGKPKP